MSEINRFISRQEKMYDIAYKEIKNGKKTSHWMWYIFPQINGLGKSDISKYYAIKDIEEAKEYFNNEYLKKNYLKLCELLIELDSNKVFDIFGEMDSLKLQSSLTLFYIVSDNKLIHHVLEKYYNGEFDQFTTKYLEYNLLIPPTIKDKLDDLNIAKSSYELINKLDMFDLLKQMVSENNDINLCLNDLKYAFNSNEIIGYISLDNNNVKLNKLLNKEIKCLLVYIEDEKFDTNLIKDNNKITFYCFNKKREKDVRGFIFG